LIPSDIGEAAVLALVLLILGMGLTRWWRKSTKDTWFFSVAFGLRIATIVLLTDVLQFRFDDEVLYDLTGRTLPYGLFSLAGGRGYYHLVGLTYSIAGPNELLPKVANAFVGSLLPFLVYDIAKQIHLDAQVAVRAFLFAVFLPPLVIFSAVALKELGTATLLTLSLWFLAQASPNRNRKVLLAVLALVALYWLRGSIWTLLGLVGVLTFLALEYRGQYAQMLNRKAAGWILLGGLAVVLVVLPGVVEKVVERMTFTYPEELLQSQATVAEFIDTSRPFSLQTLSVLLVRGIFFPTPFRFLIDHGVSPLLESLVSGVSFVLVPFAVIGFLREPSHPILAALAMVSVTMLVIAALGVPLGSDIFRHRIAMFPMLYILAAGGMITSEIRRRWWVLLVWWASAFLFTGLWAWVRLN